MTTAVLLIVQFSYSANMNTLDKVFIATPKLDLVVKYLHWNRLRHFVSFNGLQMHTTCLTGCLWLVLFHFHRSDLMEILSAKNCMTLVKSILLGDSFTISVSIILELVGWCMETGWLPPRIGQIIDGFLKDNRRQAVNSASTTRQQQC